MDHAETQSTPSPLAAVTGLNTNAPSIDDRVASIGGSFLQSLDDNPDPNQHDNQENVAAEPEAEATETPEAPAQEATEQEELEEAEFEGKQYKVPKEIKRALLREADYTRKTQEVAEVRKQLERITQASQQLFQQAQQFAPVFGQAHQLDQQIRDTASKLTPDLESNDPLTYVQLQTKLLALNQQKQQVGAQLHQANQQFQQQQMALRMQSLQAELPKLAKDIPGFEKPETRQELAKWAMNNGASQTDMEALNWSPFLFRAIHMAREVESLKASNEKALKTVQAKVVNAPPVKPTGRSQESAESQTKQLRSAWKKGGGSIHDPNFDAYLTKRLGG